MNQTKLREKLYALVERDHGGCDQNTCDLSIAMRHGFDCIAIERWAGSGAACDTFYRLYEKLGPSFKRLYDAEMEAWNFAYADCPHCNAVLWLPEETDYYCDSCAKDIPRTEGVSA